MRNHRMKAAGTLPYKITSIGSYFGFTDIYEVNQYGYLGGMTSWQIYTQNIPTGTHIYATIENITTVDSNFGCNYCGSYAEAMRYQCLVQNNSTGLNWYGRFNGLPDGNRSFYVHFRKNSYTGEIFYTQQFTWYDSSYYLGQSATNNYYVIEYGPTAYDVCVNPVNQIMYLAYIPYGANLHSHSETHYHDAEATSLFTGWVKFTPGSNNIYEYYDGYYAGSSTC